MELITKDCNVFGTMLQINLPRAYVEDVAKLVAKGKELRISVKAYRQKRSLDANAALWVMCEKIAHKMNSTAWEIYLHELQQYGVSDWMAVLPETLNAIQHVYRVVKQRGECTINGIRMLRLQVWRGSSTYDTKEMSTLIDGVIQDAEKLGCEFISKQDILWEEVKKDECK